MSIDRTNHKIKLPELLSPAGNFEKMRAALLYGADAVYLAGLRFGMRSAADNFSDEELADAVAYAHTRGKKIYLTLNTMPHNYEYPALRDFLLRIAPLGIDAVIVADLGVLATVRELLPEMEIHISTQASIVSPQAARAYAALGAKRLVLARELMLDEIRAIRDGLAPEIELEAFIHGSMCVAYSGRCMLSYNLTGRDANRGACAQPCRWTYSVTEEKRPEIPFPIEQNELGTFTMSSKDMCTIEILPKLIEAGIDSFKIEGRMKSAYYTAVVTNTYKMALDSYFSGNYSYNPDWYRELESVSHRDYATGYYYSDSHMDSNTAATTGYIKDKAYLAVVVSYDEEKSVATLSQRNKMKVGDEIELLSPGKCGVPLTVGEMKNEKGEIIEGTSHPYMIFTMKIDIPVKAGDIIRAR